jgi:hypothetical protein
MERIKTIKAMRAESFTAYGDLKLVEIAEPVLSDGRALVRITADELLERHWPVHVVDHLAAMADLHRAGSFDRMSDEVLMLTGQRPLTVREFVRKNAAAFTASAKAA